MKKLFIAILMAFNAFGSHANDIVTLIVPVAPGGGTDVLARAIVENMTRQGIPMMISNKPGAERSIGANFVATANPDGKTLFLGAISDTVLLPLFKYPGLQFNEDTFVPVAFLATLPPVITASNNVPANNFKELVELIKKDPSKYQIGSFGKLSVMQANAIFAFAGATPTIVNYKGDVPLAVDLVGGHIPLGLNSLPPVKELAKDGKLKIITMLTDERNKDFPNVGTIHEANKWSSYYWFGIFAPPGTNPELVKKYHTAFNNALNDEDVKTKLASQSYKERIMTQQQFAKFYKDQLKFYKPLVDQLVAKENK